MKRKPLRRVSKHYRSDLDLFHKTVKPNWLKEHPRCEFHLDETSCMLPGWRCGDQWGVTIHHKMGRGKYLNDTDYFMTVCPEHHTWIEDHKRAARELGYILYK
jgi:hypothetical protein